MKLKACFHTKDATGRYKIMYNEKTSSFKKVDLEIFYYYCRCCAF